ncbi:MAG TPA: response regulator [Cyclobacteriaceae bacterium]|nr:response regulator [Cyclobacteriaceae bacterium]
MSDLSSYLDSGSFYKAVVEDGSDIIIILDYEGNIRYCNPSTSEILGYNRKQLVNKSFFEFILPEFIDEFKDSFEKVKELPYAEKIEFQFLCADGHYTFLEFNSINLKHKENIEGLILDCRDISQRKKFAEELVQAQKTKEQFLAKISHEIRTPINGIIGMTNLLTGSYDIRERNSYLNAIKYSAENLKVIINDILDLSLIESGKLKFEKIGFKISELVPSLISTFSFHAKEKNNELVYSISPKLDKVLLGDPVRLNQILSNLLSNAIKFTTRGKIIIDAINLQEDNGICTVQFSVKDNGVGIQPEKLSLIFESFSQADESITRKFGGTGLGLTIARQLVELQGGEIGVTSVVNKGSEFTFSIPYPVGTEKDMLNLVVSNEIISLASTFDKLSVLLVEDNDINRLYAGTLLKRWNFSVDFAENGLIAVEKIKSGNTYDIILMDIMMPVMDGFEATKEIRKINKKVPIIAVSATANKADHENSIACGMNDFITKPFNPDELFLLLNRLDTSTKTFQSSISDIPPKSDVIDLNYLKQISGNNKEFIDDMLNTLVTSIPKTLVDIEDNIQKKDLKGVYGAIHKLKPSLDLLGLKNIKELAVSFDAYYSKSKKSKINSDEEAFNVTQELLNRSKNILEQLNEMNF